MYSLWLGMFVREIDIKLLLWFTFAERERGCGQPKMVQLLLKCIKDFGFSPTFKGECIHVFMLYKELIFKKLLCHQNTNLSTVFPEKNLLLFQLILSSAPSVIILVSQWALRSLLSLLLSNTSLFSSDFLLLHFSHSSTQSPHPFFLPLHMPLLPSIWIIATIHFLSIHT